MRADEHVSPEILRAIQGIALSPGWELTSVRDTPERGASDVHWITAFARDGGEAILSADTDFLRIPAQVKAVFDTGLRVIHLPGRWARATGRLQAAHILLWWGRIEVTVTTMNPRECFEPPWNIDEGGMLRKIILDFAGAERKARQAARRAGP